MYFKLFLGCLLCWTAVATVPELQLQDKCLYHGSFLPHPTNCSQYFVCTNDGVIERSCDDGLYFDVKNHLCTPLDTSINNPACGNVCTSEMEGRALGRSLKSHLYFWKCREGKITIDACPLGEFDWLDLSCTTGNNWKCYIHHYATRVVGGEIECITTDGKTCDTTLCSGVEIRFFNAQAPDVINCGHEDFKFTEHCTFLNSRQPNSRDVILLDAGTGAPIRKCRPSGPDCHVKVTDTSGNSFDLFGEGSSGVFTKLQRAEHITTHGRSVYFNPTATPPLYLFYAQSQFKIQGTDEYESYWVLHDTILDEKSPYAFGLLSSMSQDSLLYGKDAGGLWMDKRNSDPAIELVFACLHELEV